MILKLVKYVLTDIARSKWVLLYAVFFFVTTEGLLFFTAGEAKTVVGLMNVVLLLIPLASIMFGALQMHNSREFIELMLTQPIERRSIFIALYVGVIIPFMAAFTLGIMIPATLHGMFTSVPVLTLLIMGNALTMVFFAVSFAAAIIIRDKAAAMGMLFLLWLFFAVIYDGVILAITVTFSDYPMEAPTIAMMVCNPIDLARIIVMLTFDYAALMGYTGAVFNEFFGTARGILIASTSLAVWTILPLFVGHRAFNKKDW